MDEFYGLREYRVGDSWKVIDWKHSARGRGWQSREMTMLIPPHVLVRLDLRKGTVEGLAEGERAERVEQAISLTASLVHEACQAGLRVGLQVCGVAAASHPVASGRGHLQGMLRTLAVLDANKVGDADGEWASASVIVCPGSSQETRGGRVAVLGAADLQRYVLSAGPLGSAAR